uniref:Protein translation factor SUI1 homolog n=1 Tax=Oryza meridionalis TaxID=40149 RepID=A0A0E0C8R6_9ORYZ
MPKFSSAVRGEQLGTDAWWRRPEAPRTRRELSPVVKPCRVVVSLAFPLRSASPIKTNQTQLANFMSDLDVQLPSAFDPFAEANAEDSSVGAGSKDYVHVRIQQRNGRKSLTTVQGLKKEYSYNKILKDLKKEFCCNGTVVQDPELGQVIQLQGDQRKNVATFLVQRLRRELALLVGLQLRHPRRREGERTVAVAVHELDGVRLQDLAVRGEHHQARDALDLEPLAEALLATDIAEGHGGPRHGAVEPLEGRSILVARHEDDLEAGAVVLEPVVGGGQRGGEGLALGVPVCSEVQPYDLAL